MENQPYQNNRFSHISTENSNNDQIVKNKTELKAKTKQITESQNKTDNLKIEVNTLKSKNFALISNPNVFAGERKKYRDSVLDELFKDSKIAGALLSLLKFGSQKNTQSYEPEEIPEDIRKRRLER